MQRFRFNQQKNMFTVNFSLKFFLNFYNLKKVSKEKKPRISLNSNLNIKFLIIYIAYSSGEGKWLTWHWLNR